MAAPLLGGLSVTAACDVFASGYGLKQFVAWIAVGHKQSFKVIRTQSRHPAIDRPAIYLIGALSTHGYREHRAGACNCSLTDMQADGGKR